MKKYYDEGGTRVAMRVGSSTRYYLLTDHLGSTTINANYDGTLNGEKRYMLLHFVQDRLWGEERYKNGTTLPPRCSTPGSAISMLPGKRELRFHASPTRHITLLRGFADYNSINYH